MSDFGTDRVELLGGDVSVDATLIARDLGLEADRVLVAMREGRLTARCERGAERDVGRMRLTFYYGHRRLRLIIDAAGQVLERSATHLRKSQVPTRPKGG